MKSKNWNEIKNMSDVELRAELGELQDRIFRLRFRHSTSPVKNPLEIRKIRRNIARVKTLINWKKSLNKINNGKEQ
ncbi:50S ribosomal protein L29 [Candidatus Endomicrobiellum agilis]|jgi:large subunit ribosomal protein L29|uniref:50S ribosomal protein L29 n=1 Tax=Candidatus Endomicrobiellum agilis TaxID=3238957 RepID=UPI00357E4DF4|nr:50S ribosomal protein L29 [Endomicrobium sp.]